MKQLQHPVSPATFPAPALEKHYRVKDLVKLWGFSRTTIVRELKDEEGVISIGNKKRCLSIPESVAIRVHERLGNKRLQQTAPRRNPLRVILLRDLDVRMTKKTRNVINAKAAQQ